MNAILMRLLLSLLPQVSPVLVDWVRALAVSFKSKAKETDNPYDDIVAEIFCAILGIGEDQEGDVEKCDIEDP